MAETFYTSFYGMRSPPFHVTPDASLFFATDTHQQAMAAIEYGVAAGRGFIVVTGEVGVGKTTVLRAVLDRFDPEKTRVIYLFNPDLTVAELYAAILEGLDSGAQPSTEPAETLRLVQESLLKFNRRGVSVVLAVDEAQNMPESTLEHLRVLSNLETRKSKLLQIVLVGQPELDSMLRRQSLRQLAQRVAVRATIAPLTFGQSCRYIVHRLTCCGRSIEPPLFTTPALWYIARRARGIPRSLNIFCDNALINGYGYNAPVISLRIVREALRPLQQPTRTAGLALRWAALSFLVLLLVGGIYLYWQGREVPTPPATATGAAPASATQPTQQPMNAPQTPSPSASTDAKNSPSASPGQEGAVAVATSEPASASGTPALPGTGDAADAGKPTPGSPPEQTAGASTAMNPTAPPSAPGPSGGGAAGDAATRDRASDADVTRANAPRAARSRTWLVKRGDSLFKACLVTYGRCDRASLRAILASNPKLRSRQVLWPGDVIVLPPLAESSPN